jgi:hypothetical protein
MPELPAPRSPISRTGCSSGRTASADGLTG